MESSKRCTEQMPEALIAYVYGEGDRDDRERVETHLAACHACSSEVEALEGLRGTLQNWTVPDPVLGFRVVSDRYEARPWWRMALEPSWGLAAAAMLVLVVLAAVASIEVRYDARGFVFRMGWTNSDGAIEGSSESAEQVEATIAPSRQGVQEQAPWAIDLARLEEELRRELAVQTADSGSREGLRSVPGGAGSRSVPLGREQVEGLITQSEQRQQEELALWLTQFAQEFDVQRRADQQRMDQELGALEGYANYLVRASQR